MTDDWGTLNYGGDPCHHYNIAWNIANGNGPVTDFIFSYWHRHPRLPALTDVYPPGVHYVLAAFLKIFGDGYGSARLGCLVFGSLAGIVVYFLSREFVGRGLACVTAAILVLNPVHLEHSTIVMTPVVASFFVWLVLLVLLRYPARRFWAGVLAGGAHLCLSSLPAIGVGLLAFEVLKSRIEQTSPKVAFQRIFAFFAGAGLILVPWGMVTYFYFGKAFYSNFNYYPMTTCWSGMFYETAPPTLSTFIVSSGGITAIAGMYFEQFFRTAKLAYEHAIPLGAPAGGCFHVLNVIFLSLGTIRLVKKGGARVALFFGFFLVMLVILSLGSTGLGGRLQPRHVVVLIPFVVILWALALDFIAQYFIKLAALRLSPSLMPYLPTAGRLTLGVFLASFAAEACSWRANFRTWERPNAEMQAFQHFWSSQATELKEAARWIKTTTPEDAVFMYAFTPQDFWGETHRRVVVDPVYSGGRPPRAREEVVFYGVDFLVLDSSHSIYRRAPHPEDLSRSYPGLKLALAWKNDANTFTIYRILKEDELGRLSASKVGM